MSDISEMVKRLRSITRECAPQYFSDSIINDAADALEAQAKEIKIYQQTELTYVTRVADAQREYSEMQAKLKARIADWRRLLRTHTARVGVTGIAAMVQIEMSEMKIGREA